MKLQTKTKVIIDVAPDFLLNSTADFSVVVFCLPVCLANVFIWLQVFLCVLLSFMIFYVMLLCDVFVWIFRYQIAFCLDGALFDTTHSKYIQNWLMVLK